MGLELRKSKQLDVERTEGVLNASCMFKWKSKTCKSKIQLKIENLTKGSCFKLKKLRQRNKKNPPKHPKCMSMTGAGVCSQ